MSLTHFLYQPSNMVSDWRPRLDAERWSEAADLPGSGHLQWQRRLSPGWPPVSTGHSHWTPRVCPVPEDPAEEQDHSVCHPSFGGGFTWWGMGWGERGECWCSESSDERPPLFWDHFFRNLPYTLPCKWTLTKDLSFFLFFFFFFLLNLPFIFSCKWILDQGLPLF